MFLIEVIKPYNPDIDGRRGVLRIPKKILSYNPRPQKKRNYET
jgi:hypothetical protein